MFSPDAPIQSAKEDILSRATFAAQLAKVIAGSTASDCFVIGIHGKWGSGKSSVINLIVEKLNELNNSAKSDEDKLYTLRFNPWNFIDQNQLLFQFFKQYRAHLSKFQGSAKKTAQKIVDALDDYADALAPPLEYVPHGGKFLSRSAKVFLGGARKILGSAKEIGAIYSQLESLSNTLKRRTIVLIDDIDRLNADETRQIFQLVKLTARFPYVIYILAFDRTAVAAALQGAGIDSGEEYLEKIVQVAFELPQISEAALSTFITQGIDALLERYKPAHFDTHRFGNVFYSGFRSSFRSVRDVRRFLNGLEFNLSLIGHELNGVDIMGIEALKTFYPKSFDAVRTNKELFAGHIDPITQDRGASEYKKQLDEILSQTGELDESLKGLLCQLFPKIDYAYTVSHSLHAEGAESEWEKSYRVATSRYFDAYFQLFLAPSEVSIREISELLRECADEAVGVKNLKKLSDAGKLKAAMDSLRFRLAEVPSVNLPTLLGALVAIGEVASDSGSPLAGQIPEYWHVRWAIFDVIEKIEPTQRPNTLLEVARRIFAPKTLTNVVGLLEELKSKKNKYQEFTNEDISGLRSAIAQRIGSYVRSAENPEPHDIPMLLYAWRTWGNPLEVAAYVRSLTDTDVKLASFLDKFICQTHTASSNEKVMRTHNRVAMEQLSEALDLKDLNDRLKNVDTTKLKAGEGDVIRFVLEQLELMHTKGVTPEQFDGSRLFLDGIV
jgi:hypothetical protein